MVTTRLIVKNPTSAGVATIALSRIIFGPKANGTRLCAQYPISPEHPLDATFRLVRQLSISEGSMAEGPLPAWLINLYVAIVHAGEDLRWDILSSARYYDVHRWENQPPSDATSKG